MMNLKRTWGYWNARSVMVGESMRKPPFQLLFICMFLPLDSVEPTNDLKLAETWLSYVEVGLKRRSSSKKPL